MAFEDADDTQLQAGDDTDAQPGAIPDGSEDVAAAMPTIPGNQSESGIPRPRPQGPGTQTSSLSNPVDDVLRMALSSVDQSLAYGRQKYGLSGDEQQDAAAMPTIPGNQSESGIPRPRPGGPGTQKIAGAIPDDGDSDDDQEAA